MASQKKSPDDPFRRFHSSRKVIRLVVMMYVRYPLALRDVGDLLFERGIDLCRKTARKWWNRFGLMTAGGFGQTAPSQRRVAVGLTAPFEIIGRERVVARHLAVDDLRVEQPMPFVTDEQDLPRLEVSPRVCGGSQFTKTETPNRRVGQAPDRGVGRPLSVTHRAV